VLVTRCNNTLILLKCTSRIYRWQEICLYSSVDVYPLDLSNIQTTAFQGMSYSINRYLPKWELSLNYKLMYRRIGAIGVWVASDNLTDVVLSYSHTHKSDTNTNPHESRISNFGNALTLWKHISMQYTRDSRTTIPELYYRLNVVQGRALWNLCFQFSWVRPAYAEPNPNAVNGT
jgi:hypothetical protein